MNEYIEKLKNVVKGRLVVYIDVANLERSIQSMWVNPKDIPDSFKHLKCDELRWSADYKKFKSFFASLGMLDGVRFYSAAFGTDSHIKFLYFLKKRLGFKLTTKPLKEYQDHTIESIISAFSVEQMKLKEKEEVEWLVKTNEVTLMKSPK